MNKWLILFCAFLVFVYACRDDASKIADLAAECRSGNREACQDLADIAKGNEDWVICEDAVEKLTNQSTLTDIARNAEAPPARWAAIGKLTDQTLLVKIALEDFFDGDEAINRLADLASRNAVASDDKDWRVRMIHKYIAAFYNVPIEHRKRLMCAVLPAIRVLIYPAVVSSVGDIESIKTEWNSTRHLYTADGLSGVKPGEIFTCSIKVQKLPETLSSTWSTNFPNSETVIDPRPNKSDKLSSSISMAFECASVDICDLVREVFEKITDQALLTDIAKNGQAADVCRIAVEKLTDQKILADIAKNNNEDNYTRKVAEKRLKELQGI